MIDKEKRFEEEIAELKKDMEDFQQERERVRAIVGKIGGVPIMRQKYFEFFLLVLVIG